MKQSSTFVYVCPVSGQCIRFQHQDGALWTHAHDVVRLFGKKRPQFERALKYLLLTREIDETVDVMEATGRSASVEFRLNHRAVISLGYQLNFGRVSPLRDWFFANLQCETNVNNDVRHRASNTHTTQRVSGWITIPRPDIRLHENDVEVPDPA